MKSALLTVVFRVGLTTTILKNCSDIQFRESIEEVKKLNHHLEIVVTAVDGFREKLLKLAEKPKSKFISRPRHNFKIR